MTPKEKETISKTIEKWIDDLSIVEGKTIKVKASVNSASIMVRFESGAGYWISLNKMAEITTNKA